MIEHRQHTSRSFRSPKTRKTISRTEMNGLTRRTDETRWRTTCHKVGKEWKLQKQTRHAMRETGARLPAYRLRGVGASTNHQTDKKPTVEALWWERASDHTFSGKLWMLHFCLVGSYTSPLANRIWSHRARYTLQYALKYMFLQDDSSTIPDVTIAAR